ncbi:MAG: OsmC family protein [Armatimonadetes bacterium]|nr:OsmC family protein [Anaerolineae bacterium]
MDTIISNTEAGYRVSNTARGHEWYSDAPLTSNGADSAPNPEELLLSALGACIAMTGRMYANRKGWALTGVQVKLELERILPQDYPGCAGDSKYAHRVRETITLTGDLDDEQRNRVLEIMRKCPVRRVMENPVLFEDMVAETA